LLFSAELSKRGAAQGGYALVYAQRLRSDILGLNRLFQDTHELAKSYSELNMVEEFLLSCGKLGYSGPEMFQAVELRQELVAQAVKRRHKTVSTDLPSIKHRALFANLLISREVDALTSKLEVLKGDFLHPELLQAPECAAAEFLLLEYRQAVAQIRAAIKNPSIEKLDLALSLAAYHFFYFEEVTQAVQVLNEISDNPCELLGPVVSALRASDLSGLDPTFQLMASVGWTNSAMDSTLCSKINERYHKIVQDEKVKSKLIKYCLGIKNGFKVNGQEMMQLLRRAYKLKLDEDPLMAGYLKVGYLNGGFFFAFLYSFSSYIYCTE
jgi:hypothetical protein